MLTLHVENREAVQKLADSDRSFLEKKRDDKEIISLMKNLIINQNKNYIEERKVYYTYFFPNPYEGHVVSYPCVGIRVLPSVRSVENEAITKYFKKKGATLNINLYFNFFKQIGFEKCKQLISYFCINPSIVERLSDEQVVSIYKAFPTACLGEEQFGYGVLLSKRLRKLILENKYTKEIKKKEEITRLFNGVKTFIDIHDVNSLTVESSDLKYIVKNCNLGKHDCSLYLSCFLKINQKLINDEIRKILFNKLQKLDNYEFQTVMCGTSYITSCEYFCFYDVFKEKQLNAICCRLYNIIGEKKSSRDEARYKEKYAFVSAINKYWNSSSKEKQEISIINEIIKEMIELGFDKHEVRFRMGLIHKLIGDKKVIFGKCNFQKIYNLMKKDPKFLYAILDIYPNCDYKFSFIKDNIIDGIGEIEILKLLDKNLNSENTSNLAEEIKRAYQIIKNIIYFKEGLENEELIKKLLNKVFLKQNEQLEGNQLYFFTLEFLEESLFKYLDYENKNKVFENLFLDKDGFLNYGKLVYLIICEHININQFIYLWEHLFKRKNRFELIDALFEKNDYNSLPESFINVLNKYLNDNKLDYVRFVEKNSVRRWTDLEISYICETENIDNIYFYLKNQCRFTEQQWDRLFKYFYKVKNNPFVPFGFENVYYPEFDRKYKTITSGKKYSDGDLIDVKEKNKMNRLVKSIKKKAANDEAVFENEPLPF